MRIGDKESVRRWLNEIMEREKKEWMIMINKGDGEDNVKWEGKEDGRREIEERIMFESKIKWWRKVI